MTLLNTALHNSVVYVNMSLWFSHLAFLSLTMTRLITLALRSCFRMTCMP